MLEYLYKFNLICLGGVIMLFCEKLKTLMSIMNCTNSKLSKGINVDPSLISRWKNGKRHIKPDSPYISLIIDFLLNTKPIPAQMGSINHILKTNIQLKEDNDILKLKNALVIWLSTSDDNLEENIKPFSYLNSENFSVFINKLSEASTYNQFNTQFQFNFDILPGRDVQMSVYSGIKGKRNAVLRIMTTLISIDTPSELLCFSDENFDWLAGDKNFYLTWAALMKKAVSKGHKIKIIHIVNRSPKEVMAAIEQWTPLHLTGKVESYYMPKYISTNIKKSFWVIPKVLAAGAITASPDGLAECTYIIEDPELVNNMTNTFKGLLSQCRKYFNIYNPASNKAYFQSLIDYELSLGNTITLKDTLSSVTLPEEVFIRMLNQSKLSEEQKNKRIELHRYRLDAFIKNLSHFKFTEILSIDSLFDITNLKLTPIEDIELVPIMYSPQDLYGHIKNIIKYLNEYDNYELILIKKENLDFGNNIFFAAKDGIGAILAKWNQNSSDNVVVMTYEDYSSTVLYNLLYTHINKIPYEQRDKSYIIPRLEAYAQRLLE